MQALALQPSPQLTLMLMLGLLACGYSQPQGLAELQEAPCSQTSVKTLCSLG